ncbi:MAG: urease accessory protein UreF [Lacrimispora saccharolytica]
MVFSPATCRYAAEKTTCHPCAYGVLCACMGMDRTEVLSAFLYAQTSAMVTNCVKTIPLSQSDGQKILFSLEPLMENMIQLVEQIGAEMLCASTPAFDLRSMEHETLYSRLYMS